MTESLFQKLYSGDMVLIHGAKGKINGTAWGPDGGERYDKLVRIWVSMEPLPSQKYGASETYSYEDASLIELADPFHFFERRFKPGDIVSWGEGGLKGRVHYADATQIVIDWFDKGRIVYEPASPLLLEKIEAIAHE